VGINSVVVMRRPADRDLLKRLNIRKPVYRGHARPDTQDHDVVEHGPRGQRQQDIVKPDQPARGPLSAYRKDAGLIKARQLKVHAQHPA